jgi:hypothetical protein
VALANSPSPVLPFIRRWERAEPATRVVGKPKEGDRGEGESTPFALCEYSPPPPVLPYGRVREGAPLRGENRQTQGGEGERGRGLPHYSFSYLHCCSCLTLVAPLLMIGNVGCSLLIFTLLR